MSSSVDFIQQASAVDLTLPRYARDGAPRDALDIKHRHPLSRYAIRSVGNG